MKKSLNIAMHPSYSPRFNENTICINRDELAKAISNIMINCQKMRLLLLFLQGSLSKNPLNNNKYKHDKNRGWEVLDFLYEETSLETGKILRLMTSS